MKIFGNIVDVENRNVYNGCVVIENSRIKRIERTEEDSRECDCYIMPGLIDSHIHIESSMLTPAAFAAAAVPRGTIGVVTDPHEIANVLGIEGVRYMIKSGNSVPFYFWFGAPSCVPATTFETSGSVIDIDMISELFEKDGLKFLSEMMNWPGVVYEDITVKDKIKTARKYSRIIDGHASGLSGENLKKYVNAGISTDHECSTIEEAIEKISLGMKVLIREGSAARNLDNLKELIRMHPEMVMICSDDLHPETLRERHLSTILAKLINQGFDFFDVVRAVTYNPVQHYGLDCGLLRSGDPADFIVVKDLEKMEVLETWIKGKKVFDKGKLLFDLPPARPLNRFDSSKITRDQIGVKQENKRINVIQVYDGELTTSWLKVKLPGKVMVECDIENDIIKLVVKDRYNDNPPAVGFIKGTGLKMGAFGGTVAHDSHNIICAGTNDDDIVNCINSLVESKGGLAVTSNRKTEMLKLEIAGLMSTGNCDEVAEKYLNLTNTVIRLGSNLLSPFMTISFMALLVIPELKLSDKGLFDGKNFRLISLYED